VRVWEEYPPDFKLPGFRVWAFIGHSAAHNVYFSEFEQLTTLLLPAKPVWV
jgi:hypothetical protein